MRFSTMFTFGVLLRRMLLFGSTTAARISAIVPWKEQQAFEEVVFVLILILINTQLTSRCQIEALFAHADPC